MLHVELKMVTFEAFLCALSTASACKRSLWLAGSHALLLDTFHLCACKYEQ